MRRTSKKQKAFSPQRRKGAKDAKLREEKQNIKNRQGATHLLGECGNVMGILISLRSSRLCAFAVSYLSLGLGRLVDFLEYLACRVLNPRSRAEYGLCSGSEQRVVVLRRNDTASENDDVVTTLRLERVD